MSTKAPTVARRVTAASAAVLATGDQLRWAADASARVRLVIAGRIDLDGVAADALAGDPNRKVRLALAENPAAPAGVLTVLLGDDDFAVRWAAAQNPSADAEVHLSALAGPHDDTAEAVGQLGDALSADVVEAVLAHPRHQARWQLAQSTSSPDVLARLAADPVPAVRAQVALSRHVGQALLRELAADSRAAVRAAAAAAPGLPRDVVGELARDRSVNVRFWVTASPQYDADLARLQADDPDEDIRRHARQRSDGE